MTQMIKKGEMVSFYKNRQIFGMFTGKKNKEGLWGVLFLEKKCTGWFRLQEMFTRKMHKAVAILCPKCNELTECILNCNISECGHCSRICLDHRTRKCCFRPMFKKCHFKCMKCFALFTSYKTLEDWRNHKEILHGKETVECAQELILLSQPRGKNSTQIRKPPSW